MGAACTHGDPQEPFRWQGRRPHSAHPMAGGRVAAPKTLLWGRNVWEHLSANKKSIKGARCLSCMSPGAYSSSPAPRPHPSAQPSSCLPVALPCFFFGTELPLFGPGHAARPKSWSLCRSVPVSCILTTSFGKASGGSARAPPALPGPPQLLLIVAAWKKAFFSPENEK